MRCRIPNHTYRYLRDAAVRLFRSAIAPHCTFGDQILERFSILVFIKRMIVEWAEVPAENFPCQGQHAVCVDSGSLEPFLWMLSFGCLGEARALFFEAATELVI